MGEPSRPRPPGFVKRLGRWSDRKILKSVPEYHLFESDEQRARGIEELDHDLENSKGFWRAMMAVWITLIIVANASLCLVPMLLPWSLPGRVPIAIALQVLLAVGITLWIWENRHQKAASPEVDRAGRAGLPRLWVLFARPLAEGGAPMPRMRSGRRG